METLKKTAVEIEAKKRFMKDVIEVVKRRNAVEKAQEELEAIKIQKAPDVVKEAETMSKEEAEALDKLFSGGLNLSIDKFLSSSYQ